MKLRQEAIVCFQRGLDVTHSMEKSTIAALRKLNIKCIVAPYEADAQLAYLCAIGYCDAVLTEGDYTTTAPKDPILHQSTSSFSLSTPTLNPSKNRFVSNFYIFFLRF
jgi:hypothetical protein